MLISFPKKSSFDTNGQFRVFEMVLRGRGISPIGAIGHLQGASFCWVAGVRQAVFLKTGTFFKAKNNILCILNILNIFPVGRVISRFLASGWKPTFIAPVRKTLQFLPNLSQDFKTLYLIIHSAGLFFSMMGHNR